METDETNTDESNSGSETETDEDILAPLKERVERFGFSNSIQ
jgi:hypothetical protein